MKQEPVDFTHHTEDLIIVAVVIRLSLFLQSIMCKYNFLQVLYHRVYTYWIVGENDGSGQVRSGRIASLSVEYP